MESKMQLNEECECGPSGVKGIEEDNMSGRVGEWASLKEISSLVRKLPVELSVTRIAIRLVNAAL